MQCSQIFFSHGRSVIVIHLSFLPLVIWKIAYFTVKQPLNSMSKDGMSKDEGRCRLCTDTESRCKIGIMLFNFTPIRSPHIFITVPQVARKGKSRGWTSKRVSKRTLHASALSAHCVETNEKPRNKMRIHFGCSTTHGHTKLGPHWIPRFH